MLGAIKDTAAKGKTMRRLENSIGTVEKLKLALLSCLNEKEYCDVTVSELSRRAGINRTTFYLLFGSKDELCAQLCDSVIDQWFQDFFDLNIVKKVEAEKELFLKLLAWIDEWRPALRRLAHLRTESFDGFSLLAESFERKMASQVIFRTDDRKKHDLFIRIYSVGLTSMLSWIVDQDGDFDAEEFHAMIQKLRYKGFYSIVDL